MADNDSETTVISEETSAIWEEPFSLYTREDAIEDGVLVDAQAGDFQNVSRQHLGASAS